VIFVVTRLIFAVPSMYIEGEKTIKSLKHSFHLTKGHFFQVFLVIILIFTISLFSGVILKPVQASYSNALLATNTARIILNIFLVLVFLLLEAYVNTFERLFLFYTYIDFKEFEDTLK
jgi:membrane-anchored glycerophosphoryl diester phosphodiesterase (GDPDase)